MLVEFAFISLSILIILIIIYYNIINSHKQTSLVCVQFYLFT